MTTISDSVSVKYDAPLTLAEGYEARDRLKQQLLEAQAALIALNAEQPPRYQTINFEHWKERRGGAIRKLRAVLEHYAYVKTWVSERQQEAYLTDRRPSRELHSIQITMRRLEELYVAVGEYLEDSSDQRRRDALTSAYDALRMDLEFMEAGTYTR